MIFHISVVCNSNIIGTACFLQVWFYYLVSHPILVDGFDGQWLSFGIEVRYDILCTRNRDKNECHIATTDQIALCLLFVVCPNDILETLMMRGYRCMAFYLSSTHMILLSSHVSFFSDEVCMFLGLWSKGFVSDVVFLPLLSSPWAFFKQYFKSCDLVTFYPTHVWANIWYWARFCERSFSWQDATNFMPC